MKRNRYNPVVARTKQNEQDNNCCFTDKNKTKRGTRYRHKAGGEGNKGASKKGKKERQKEEEDDSKSLLDSLLYLLLILNCYY